MTEEELINKASVLNDLDYDQCKQICKNTCKQTVDGKPLIVVDRAMRNFQLAVTMAKHYEWTSRELRSLQGSGNY